MVNLLSLQQWARYTLNTSQHRGLIVRTITINQHPFTLLGLIDHRRLDGTATKLYHWQGQCSAAGCTATWQFKTPALNRVGQLVPADDPSRHYAHKFTWKHCAQHRPKSKRRTYATTYMSRQTVTDDEVANMREIAKSFVGSRADLYQCMSLLFGVTSGTAREILSGRRRATAT